MDSYRFGKFMAKVSPEPNSGCWLWAAGADQHGYGRFAINKEGKTKVAHRLSYEHFVGQIPEGYDVCHKCDIPACVNPDHLFAGSRKDNMHDCATKGRSALGEKNGCSVLTEESIRYIRTSPAPNIALARELGVANQTISNIRLRKTWRHVA